MPSKNKNSGFTLVELMITITIIGILSTTVTMSIRNFVVERRAEVDVVAFYNQLKTVRTLAKRDNRTYIVRVTAAEVGAPSFTVHRINNAGAVVAVTEPILSDQVVISNAIRTTQLPAPIPPELGGGINNWTADRNNGIVFRNDEIGTINSGALFLQNARIDDIIYAIIRPAPDASGREINEIQLFRRRGGGNWVRL